MVVYGTITKPIIAVLLNDVSSGTLPNKVFLGLQLITGEIS